jgi:uncharacterized protein
MSFDPQNNALNDEDFDALDEILDDLRTRGEDVPQWEFCEGAMAALLCTRRLIPASEYLPLLLGTEDDVQDGAGTQYEQHPFSGEAQFRRFMDLWNRRWSEVATALDAEVETLEDERCYHPELMDVRGAVAALDAAARAELGVQELPAYGQVWAAGFMFVVENWPEEWTAPRDKDAAGWLNGALDSIVALTEDDEDPPTVSMHLEDGPPSVSVSRLNGVADAIWAVYNLRQLWQSLGPRVEAVRKEVAPGRNDPCWCGSGKKFKKCHGA